MHYAFNHSEVSAPHQLHPGTPKRGCITGALHPCLLKVGQRGHRCPYIPVS